MRARTMRRVLPAALLVASTLTALAPVGLAAFDVGAAVQSVQWGAPGAPAEASPGEFGRTLTVTFRNVDTVTFKDVEATLGEVAGIAPSYGPGATVTRAGTFAPGQLWSAQFTVDIAPTVERGKTFEVPVSVEMRANADGATWVEGQKFIRTYDVEVAVPGRTLLVLEPARDTLEASDRERVQLRVENQGDGRAGTIDLTFAPAAGSGLHVASPQAPVRLASLAGGEARTVDLELLTPQVTGVHPLTATVTYANAVGASVTETRTIAFVVSYVDHDPVAVALASDRLTAGREGALNFTLTNAQDQPLDGLTATLVVVQTSQLAEPALVPLGASNTASFGRLAPGVSVAFDVRLLPARDAPDTQEVRLDLRWRDGSGFDQEDSLSFGVLVGGAIDVEERALRASLDRRTGVLTVSGTLTNTGNVDASNTYLAVAPDERFTAFEPTYLGDLDPNSPVPFVLEVDARADELEAPYDPVVLVVSWTDDLGATQEASYRVPMRVHTSVAPATADEDGGFSSLLVGALAVLSFVVAGSWYVARRRREGERGP